MTKTLFLKSTLLTLLVCLVCNDSKSQTYHSYIDSIKHYQIFVDSLIHSYHLNPATNLSHAIIHYSCPGANDTYGSGGSTDLYQDTTGARTYQLYYIKGCDTVITESTYYFMDNKIVIAVISDAGSSQRISYYRNDKLLRVPGLNRVTEKLAQKDLTEGYRALKDFQLYTDTANSGFLQAWRQQQSINVWIQF